MRGVSGGTGVGHIVGVSDGGEGPLDSTMGTTGHRVGGARGCIHGCSMEERRRVKVAERVLGWWSSLLYVGS